jgi:hypothetical protein
MVLLQQLSLLQHQAHLVPQALHLLLPQLLLL